jgi:hypothetical protein
VWTVAAGLILLVFVALLASLYALASTRVPVVRTPREHLAAISAAAGIRHGTVVVDAGCGDARALLTLCTEAGVTGRGYELNGPVWLYGWFRVLFAGGGRGRVRVRWSNFFRCELEDVDVVYCYLMPGSMQRVARKCSEEMRPGARLVSYLWEVPGWEPVRTLELGPGQDPLYVYEVHERGPGDGSCGSKT